ncbi:amino acid permease [Schaalia georgiae]|uniref:amino acid permease n=1 Tax=Schaalia georgiae TaxID=52768 RepID=UPI00311CA715
MMALGLAIGAGFFLGTGQAIAEAGPAVLVSYALAALIVVSVMFALAELASALPSTGSFSTYAEAGIGRWAGFTIGWLYWIMLIMVTGIEISGAAEIFVRWFPSAPRWLVALAVVVVLGAVNLMAAGRYGEVEAWLSMVKVVAIVAFLVVGVVLVGRSLVLGPLPGHEPIWTTVFGHGGFAPKHMGGIAVGLLAVITSFGGIEIITIAAAEADDAQAAMSSAIRSVIMRILVFYVGSVILMIALLPWDGQEMRTGAFAAILSMAGVPYVGTVMEVIIFMALISAYSANVYASSRMAYSLSARGMGWRWLLGAPRVSASAIIAADEARSAAVPGASTRDGQGTADEAGATRADGPAGPGGAAPDGEEAAGAPQGPEEAGLAGIEEVLADEDHGDIAQGRTPRRAVGLIIALSLISVALNWYLPETALSLLINAVGMVLLIVWTFILVAQMRLHRSLDAAGRITIRMPGWPWLGWVVLAGLAFVAGLMAWSETGRQQLVAMGGLTLIIVVVYFVRQLWSTRR